ncbi:MAG: co-chaperone GroES [Eggerthellaceae bacterium]|nr:co-chaperone GroES [Eggerthellaceae bacterium]
MNLKPLGDRVIVKQDDAEEVTAGGLFLSSGSKEKPTTCTVLAVGDGRVADDGKVIPVPVKKGDRVIYGKYGGTEVEIGGETVVILRADDIYAIQA